MTTIGSFIRQPDAMLALSRLQAAGIQGFLFDEISLSVVGAGTTAIPVRLEVADEDAAKAGRVLRGEDGAGPLPDDFIPPEGVEPDTGNLPELTAKEVASAFIEGGILTLATVGLPSLAVLANGGRYAPTLGGMLLLFGMGGLGGILVYVYRKGRKKEQEEEGNP